MFRQTGPLADTWKSRIIGYGGKEDENSITAQRDAFSTCG